MPLQIKYRPTTFENVIGNKGTALAIKETLERNDHNHSMLLTGGSGCGKTTVAYLIASHLEVYGTSNFREYNSADFRGIDAIRAIRQESLTCPLSGGVRVFFMDECHKLTPDAQEMLLKILEDASNTINYYILATTNPEKLTATLKRRCAEYELRACSSEQVESLLERIVKREKVPVPKEVLEYISENANGSPGIACKMLDSIIATEPSEMLNTVKQSEETKVQVIDLCRALITKKKWGEVARILSNLKTEDPENIRRAILGYCSVILLKKDDARAYLIMDAFSEPTYNTGFPGIVRASYMSLYAE